MRIRPMEKNDIASVISVINSHDEDDARDAAVEFEQFGAECHWVADINGEVAGITGYRRIPETIGSAYVSWTYVHAKHCRKGAGKKIFSHMLEHAENAGAEKLFVKVSNYVDDEGHTPYLAATKLYEAFNFQCEVMSKDFYDVGEDQLIYSKRIVSEAQDEPKKLNEKPTIRFIDVFEIPETNGAYTFSWAVKNKQLFKKRTFSVNDLYIGLDEVAARGGRIVFVTFLSNLPLIHSPLSEAGFKFIGQLEDYYEPGIHELHFVHRMNDS